MKYLIYTRVSPKGSTFEGETTVRMQEQICRDYIAYRKGVVVGVITDDLISGKDTKRPGITEIFAQLESGAAEWESVCVYKLDRLTRSMLDQLTIFSKFAEANKGIVSATEPHFDYSTPIGRLQLSQIAAINQYQREVLAENTKNKMISIAASGGWPPGHPPFGYMRGARKDNTLYVDPRKSVIVKEIFSMYASPAHTTKDICKKFGLGTQTILWILRNRIYIGDIVYDGKVFKGRHEPIIPLELFEAVQRILPDYRRHVRPKGHKYPYLLGGLIHCHCGRFMCPASAKSGQFHYYRCTDNINCKNSVSAVRLEAKLLDVLHDLKIDDRYRKKLHKEVLRRKDEFVRVKMPEAARLDEALRAAEKERDDVYRILLAMKGQDPVYLSDRLDCLTKEIELISRQLKEYSILKTNDKILYDEMDRVVDQMQNVIEVFKAHPENKALQRQVISANVSALKAQKDGSFSLQFNYASSSHSQGWLPRQDSNLD